MSRWFVIVAVLFVLVGGGVTVAVAQDATPGADALDNPCVTMVPEASPMMGSPMAAASPEAMGTPVAMTEGTPVLTVCATPEMGAMEMGTPTS